LEARWFRAPVVLRRSFACLGLYFVNLIEGVPAIQILLLAMVPPVFFHGARVLRLTAVMELLPSWKPKLLADGWIWTLLAAVVPFLAFVEYSGRIFTRQIRCAASATFFSRPDKLASSTVKKEFSAPFISQGPLC